MAAYLLACNPLAHCIVVFFYLLLYFWLCECLFYVIFFSVTLVGLSRCFCLCFNKVKTAVLVYWIWDKGLRSVTTFSTTLLSEKGTSTHSLIELKVTMQTVFSGKLEPRQVFIETNED